MAEEIRALRHLGSAPTVVFLNGMAMPLELWRPVTDLLDPEVSWVLFDRPHRVGHPGGDAELIAAEIDEALGPARRPVVVVGHSFGGLLAEIYARRRPRQVGAVVLVDSSLPGDYAAGPHLDRGDSLPLWRRAASELINIVLAAPLMDRALAATVVATGTRTGRFRRAYAQVSRGARAHLRSPANTRRAMHDDNSIAAVSRTVLAERARHPLNAPVTVLVGDVGPRVWPSRLSGWLSRQQRRAADLNVEVSVFAVDGAHLLMLDRPQEIAAAVTFAVSQIRRAGQS